MKYISSQWMVRIACFLAAACVAAALVYVNLRRYELIPFWGVGSRSSMSLSGFEGYGWPLTYLEQETSQNLTFDPAGNQLVFVSIPTTENTRNGWCQGFDILLGILMVAAPLFAYQPLFRQKRKWHQFTLGGIFTAMLFVAILLTIYRMRCDKEMAIGGHRIVTQFLQSPIPVRLALLAGLWCLFSWVVYGAGRCIFRRGKRIREHGPEREENEMSESSLTVVSKAE